ncbi:hypothetical protein [Bacillus pumilus]|uniref:hypothetical protein n=1 Tax=Bacillus pumilus TaxID=1408 RepID=UPI0021CD0405|nr:hypothetical protein [Bacillus pumilus]
MGHLNKLPMKGSLFQRVDKPSHSLSVLRAGAHECQIRSAPVLVLPRLQRFSITLKGRQRAKINIILALCQQSANERQLVFSKSDRQKNFFRKIILNIVEICEKTLYSSTNIEYWRSDFMTQTLLSARFSSHVSHQSFIDG